MLKTRRLFSQECRSCDGTGWIVSQWPGNPPERDGCPDCYQGRQLGIIDGAWHKLRSQIRDLKLRVSRWRRRNEPKQIVPTLTLREQARLSNLGAPRPMRDAANAAMLRHPGLAFKLYRFRDQWAVHATHVRTNAFGSTTLDTEGKADQQVIEEVWHACRRFARELATPAERDHTPQSLRLGMEAVAIREIQRGIHFRIVYSPEQDMWAVVADRDVPQGRPYHGSTHSEKKFSGKAFRMYPPHVMEQQVYQVCREMVKELLPNQFAHGPIPCRDKSELIQFLDNVKDKHLPDGLLSTADPDDPTSFNYRWE